MHPRGALRALLIELDVRGLAATPRAVAVALCHAQHVAFPQPANLPTLPSTIAEELATNPFLRADQTDLRRRFGGPAMSDAEIFGAIRGAKDRF